MKLNKKVVVTQTLTNFLFVFARANSLGLEFNLCFSVCGVSGVLVGLTIWCCSPFS